MTSIAWPSTGTKRQRLLVIIGDDSIMEQIENNNSVSLFKEIILPSDGNSSERTAKQVGVGLFGYRGKMNVLFSEQGPAIRDEKQT